VVLFFEIHELEGTGLCTQANIQKHQETQFSW